MMVQGRKYFDCLNTAIPRCKSAWLESLGILRYSPGELIDSALIASITGLPMMTDRCFFESKKAVILAMNGQASKLEQVKIYRR